MLASEFCVLAASRFRLPLYADIRRCIAATCSGVLDGCNHVERVKILYSEIEKARGVSRQTITTRHAFNLTALLPK